MKVEIPCEHSEYNSAKCEGGTLLIYGELGAFPPRWIQCPNCKGTGLVKVEEMELIAEIEFLADQRTLIDEKVDKIQSWLDRARNNEIFEQHLQYATKTVEDWPDWKKNCLTLNKSEN